MIVAREKDETSRMRWSIIAVLLSAGVACDDLPQGKQSGSREQERQFLNSCNDIRASVKGVDEEIRERLWRVWDVKWKLRVFGGVGKGLFDQMRQDNEAIIQARAKRAELEYRANGVIPPEGSQLNCHIDQDEWDRYEIKNLSCLVPVRANNPDGYSLMNHCPTENAPNPQ